MTDLSTDLKAYFVSKGLMPAEAIFRDTMLDTPDFAVGLFEYAGTPGRPQVAGGLMSFQISVRSLSAAEAQSKARELYHSLETDDGIIDLTTERWGMVHLRQTPFKLKVDAKDRTYYAFNVGITTYID